MSVVSLLSSVDTLTLQATDAQLYGNKIRASTHVVFLFLRSLQNMLCNLAAIQHMA